MPTINIPPKVRFALYLIGVVGAVLVQYAIDKQWFGEAELRLWSGIAAVLFALALAKTSLADDTATVTGTVVSESGETGEIEAVIVAPDADKQSILGKAVAGNLPPHKEQPGGMRARRNERGGASLAVVLAVVALTIVLMASVGAL